MKFNFYTEQRMKNEKINSSAGSMDSSKDAVVVRSGGDCATTYPTMLPSKQPPYVSSNHPSTMSLVID